MGKISLPNKWQPHLLVSGALLLLFSSSHLIDDFIYDIPEDFGVSIITAQILAGFFHVQLVIIYILVSWDSLAGYVGTLFWGIFLTFAGLLKHIPEIVKPGPYWSGFYSEAFILGMIFFALAQTHFSILAILDWQKQSATASYPP